MKEIFVYLSLITCLALCFIICSCLSKSNEEKTYKNSKVESDLFMASDIQDFYDNVDVNYGYNLTCDLATNPDLCDFMLWRTAGSNGEHKAADFLVNEMNKIGLQDVEKIGVPCDKFQLNNTCLKIENTDIDLKPGSHLQSGTKGDLKALIVNCGKGYIQDYEGKDVKGKIALIQIDERDDFWINLCIRQAYEVGVAALVVWCNSGFGEASLDNIPMTDPCCEDLLPTAAISANQAKKIIHEIENGNNSCILNIDNILEPGNGTTYNVVGKIPGKSHNNRILIAGHYDKYWEGFQDDCAAIGLVFTVAKAMIDSGYIPENDIYFICHGAEEWGKLNSNSDWAAGSWELCEHYPEFCSNTLALINCELPCFEREKPVTISSDPEFKTLISDLLQQKLLVTSGNIELNYTVGFTSTKEDGISYRCHGVPHIYDGLNDDIFLRKSYHASSDNKSTYSEDTFKTVINWFGAIAIYIDALPANPLDISKTAQEISDNFNTQSAYKAGVDVDSYKKALDNLLNAANTLNKKILDCNNKYNDAFKNNDEAELYKLRSEGKKLNKLTHDAFKMVQDSFLKIKEDDVYYAHQYTDDNLEIINETDDMLNNKQWFNKDEDGLKTHLSQLNQTHNLYYNSFSYAVANRCVYEYTNSYCFSVWQSQWAWMRYSPVIEMYDLQMYLNKTERFEDLDIEKVKSGLEDGRQQCYKIIKDDCIKEIKAMNDLATFISTDVNCHI